MTVGYLPADPNYVVALALFHAERGDDKLLRKVFAEIEEERAERRWMGEHRPQICRKLAGVHDPALVRRVAELVGYRAEE